MSSFFTTPASQRKRKRIEGGSALSFKKRNLSGGVSKSQDKSRERERRDDSISGSDSEVEKEVIQRSGSEEEQESSESDLEDETGAERRLRLAQRYLENIKGEVQDEVGFDAAEIDRDLIAERLKEDVAESKGRLYRHIADSLSIESASYTPFCVDQHSTTAVATCIPYMYTVSKDIGLIKWQIPDPSQRPNTQSQKAGAKKPRKSRPLRRRPEKLIHIKGDRKKSQDTSYRGHTDNILAVAASEDGKFVVTGGRDRRLIVWNANDLMPLRVFQQHRDSVTGLVFRRGTNQLYSSSKDRTIKIWSLDELAYIETLFGHQDEVVDVAALALEHCVSVGARDRTARLWKIVDETQLVFRGGSGEKKSNKITHGGYSEGSIDRVAMVDEETFVTGSDNGSISLWNTQKKKPVFTLPLAHGRDDPPRPSEVSAEANPKGVVVPEPQPRWITALATIPYSDLVVSGSWDGCVRVWKISEDKKSLRAITALGKKTSTGDDTTITVIDESGLPVTRVLQNRNFICRGIVNDISIFERGDRGNDGVCIVAAIGKEHRLGRWMKLHDLNQMNPSPKNGGVLFEVSKVAAGTNSSQPDQQNIQTE